MEQSTFSNLAFPGLHVAIIMDGNGRWATARGLPRGAGHREGARAVRRVVEAAPRLGIGTLTLFAFSADNWQRPPGEVAALLRLFENYLMGETPACVKEGIRLSIIGRRDRLPTTLRAVVEAAGRATARGRTLHLRLAVDYSGRTAILHAAARLNGEKGNSREAFSRLVSAGEGSGPLVPDVDLLIRTGGEQRLSDFLLWECAYAELLFRRRMWPEFDAEDLEAALEEFHSRERRFGQVATVDAPAANAKDTTLCQEPVGLPGEHDDGCKKPMKATPTEEGQRR
jgi:undecaprenyl diphosphate synthase